MDTGAKESLKTFYIITTLFLFSGLISGVFGLSGTGNLNFSGIDLPGFKFLAIYFSNFILMILVFLLFPGKSYKRRIFMLLGLSIAARIFVSFQAPSDDVFRYIWEGMVFKNGFNPYLLSPDSPVLKALSESFNYHNLINHKGIPAVYPPMIILLFSFTSIFTKSILSAKIISITFDLLSVILLIKILERRKTDIRWAILYALNPLVLYSFAGGAHIDSIQNFFLLLAFLMYERKIWTGCFLALGFAFQVKFVAVIVFPFFLKKENIKYIPLILLPSILFFLPFINENPLDIIRGLKTFYSDFAFNGPVHTLIKVLTGDMKLASTLTRYAFILLYFALGFKIYSKSHDPLKGIYFSFALILLLTPTLHIWYICWILPFAVLNGAVSWVVLSLFASFYYLTLSFERGGAGWGLPLWAVVIEWTPFFLFFIFELFYSVKRYGRGNYKSIKTVCAVIPVLNEEKMIVRCIESLKKDLSVDEIIVVDGGSSDNTAINAQKKGAKVLVNNKVPESGGGRGGQIKTGVEASLSDLVIIVHGDTLLQEGSVTDLKEFMNLNPDVSGGAMGSSFESSRMGFIEILNLIRTVFFGISFGDQIQFFRRESVIKDNLFPDVPLMEDVELSLRLPKTGRTVYLFGNSKVSARRWQKKGASNFFDIVSIFLIYLLKRIFVMPDTVKIYRRYYRKGR